MKKNTFAILFIVKRYRLARTGDAPVQIRVTIGGVRSEGNTNLRTDPELWNSQLGKSMGKDKVSLELNKQLEVIRVRLMQAYRELELDGKQPTAREVMDAYLAAVTRLPSAL